MLKTTKVSPSLRRIENQKSLTEKILDQCNDFIDKFDNSNKYPPAIIKAQNQKLISKKKPIREAVIEDINFIDKDGRTYLHRAALGHDKVWLEFICKSARDEAFLKCDNFGKTPLHYAAGNRFLRIMLLNRSNLTTLLTIKDKDGNTPLHIMANTKNFDISIIYSMPIRELRELLSISNLEGKTVLEIINESDNQDLQNTLKEIL